MGRQHTTWISDETWDRLKNIAGDSVSKKISNAVKFADPDEMMRQNALMRQYEAAKVLLRRIGSEIPYDNRQVALENIDQLLSEGEWIWGVDVREN